MNEETKRVIIYDEMKEMTPDQWRWLLKRIGKEPPRFGDFYYVGPRLKHPWCPKMMGLADHR